MSRFNLSKFDLRHLRVFMSVVENEGVSAAALADGVALSTISRDLAALEVRLGVQLCHRGRGGFALTRQGQDIYKAAVDLRSQLQVFELAVQATKDAASESFKIGINDHVITNPDSGLVPAMTHLRKSFPDTLVSVSVHEATAIDVLVRERRLDVGITGQPAWLQPLQYAPMFLEEHRLYVGKICPQRDEIHASVQRDPDEVAVSIPYITRAQKTDGFKSFEGRYPLTIAGQCTNLEALLAAVLSGTGCALMPVKYVEALQRDDLLELPLKDAPLYVQFYIAFRRDAARSKGVNHFLSRFSKDA